MVKCQCFTTKSKYGVLAASVFALNAVVLYYLITYGNYTMFPVGERLWWAPYEVVRMLVNRSGCG